MHSMPLCRFNKVSLRAFNHSLVHSLMEKINRFFVIQVWNSCVQQRQVWLVHWVFRHHRQVSQRLRTLQPQTRALLQQTQIPARPQHHRLSQIQHYSRYVSLIHPRICSFYSILYYVIFIFVYFRNLWHV